MRKQLVMSFSLPFSANVKGPYQICKNLILILILNVVITENFSLFDVDNICDSPACMEKAGSIFNSLNTNVSPCDDFYGFVCGSAENKVGNILGTVLNNFERAKLEISMAVEKALTSQHSSSLSLEEEAALKNFQDCMNVVDIEERSILTFHEFFRGAFGTTFTDWINGRQNHHKLENIVENVFLNWTVDPIFHIEIVDDFSRSGYLTLLVAPPRFFTIDPKSKTKLDEIIEDGFIQFLVKLTPNYRRVVSLVESAMLLDRKMSIVAPVDFVKDAFKFTQKIAFGELKKSLSRIADWDRLLNGFIEKSGESLSDEDEIAVIGFPYLKRISEVLESYIDNDNTAAITNLLAMKFIKTAGQFMPPRFIHPLFGPTLLHIGVTHLVGRIIIDREIREVVTKIHHNIKDAFAEILKRTRWMDTETKKTALQKLKAMKEEIGIEWSDEQEDIFNFDVDFDFNFDFPEIDSLFRTDENSDFMTNGMRRLVQEQRERASTFRKKGVALRIDDVSLLPNAMYSLAGNRMLILDGLMRIPFVSEDYPNAINYGSIGSIIGHEMGHAFADSGGSFDDKGLLNQWFTEMTAAKYANITKCLEKRLLRLYPSIQSNHDSVLRENIADILGLKAAFQAFWKEERFKTSAIMLGLTQYTPEQLFFIAFAQVPFLKNKMHHPEGQLRVNAAVSSVPEFSHAFTCGRGTKMNPYIYCEL